LIISATGISFEARRLARKYGLRMPDNAGPQHMRGIAEMNNSVLIVDDEENFLLLLDWILTKDGFRVKTASDAYQALNLLDEESFNLAIIDIQMSPIDGIGLLSELRKISPSTPCHNDHRLPRTGYSS
jgi:PleD family two-component response regulator